MNAGKPQHIKLINEALIRDALVTRGEATTANLVADTGLSQTTVGQAIDQMRKAGIVLDTGKRPSKGGRRASAWVLDPSAWVSIEIAIEGGGLAWGITNALGSLVDQGRSPIKAEPLADAIALALELKASTPASALGGERRRALALGVPGAVKGGKLLTGRFLEAWADIDLSALFTEKTGIPSVVENDLNAIALGYAKAAEAGGEGLDSLVYIHFNGGSCIGSGIVLGGRILRGASSYSGELGFLPMGEGRILDDVILASEADDARYAEAIVATLETVNCVVNPALFVVGGRGFRFELGEAIEAGFKARVDRKVRPELAFVPESMLYYMAGLARLAAEQVFPGYRLKQRGFDD
jgi:hypothetical protein